MPTHSSNQYVPEYLRVAETNVQGTSTAGRVSKTTRCLQHASLETLRRQHNSSILFKMVRGLYLRLPVYEDYVLHITAVLLFSYCTIWYDVAVVLLLLLLLACRPLLAPACLDQTYQSSINDASSLYVHGECVFADSIASALSYGTWYYSRYIIPGTMEASPRRADARLGSAHARNDR